MAHSPSRICKGCWQNLHLPVPLRGLPSLPFRAVGLKPSRMNPNTCTFCELAFTTIMRARNVDIDASVMFADLRGYTGLTETLPPEAMSELLDTFYDACGNAIWAQDGLLNKTIGDAVMAVFNFPVKHGDHAARAIAAARGLQQDCRGRFAEFARTHGLDERSLGVGVGIDSGIMKFGEFGRSHRDLTAIGTVVNVAARAQAAAGPGAILVTQRVHDRTPTLAWDDPGRDYTLKGFDAPFRLFAA
ncbi:MAG: adenylate/guanylate cyclase domain-containing protein [Alphaproteobacteria bacterium]|nr:adenylate/guanylate cyclase domain-containing protein [Alphaproteobacteria bacterium]